MTTVTKTCRDINELLPVAQKACNLFLSECKKAGLDIFITETYRSQARQNYLYEQGRSRAGQKVTWTKNSRHTSRLAWDIAVNKPKSLYDVATLIKAGEIAKKLGITWGGNWDTPDMPHFEVKKDWKAPKLSAAKKADNKENKNKRIQTGGLSPDKLKKVSEYLIEKKWYAEVTFTGEGNPKVITGGLSENMQKDFEAWLKECKWSYKVID